MPESKLLWTPDPDFVGSSRLSEFRTWLADNGYVSNECSYHELWEWSVNNVEIFWKAIWTYFEVESEGDFDKVLSGAMPEARWFEGTRLNYARHVFRNASDKFPAIIFQSENLPLQEIGWRQLERNVSGLQRFLMDSGVEEGDRVCAFLPNIPEATYAFLAACGLGAVWSSCSPDFGAESVIDRFRQIEPKILIAIDGYQYGGKRFSKLATVAHIVEQLPSVEKVIVVPYLDKECSLEEIPGAISWDQLDMNGDIRLTFKPVPFEHPIWVLYSSGTTGRPKAITHSHGGVLLEHLKYLAFHNDVHPGERFFWFTTTGWMMWNYVQAALLHGATIVLYDGSPGYPNLDALWKLAEEARIEHFGTSAPFLVACMKEGLNPAVNFDLSSVRSLSSTGAPLPPEAFEWSYSNVAGNLWLCSMSGGTDVCTAFVGGCPERPVYSGEIQCRALGVSLEAFDDSGSEVSGELGEMVITRPMPSMPVFFWGDKDFARYRESYFEKYPGIWRHGDWVKITDHDGLIMYGRSDATLNRQGVRIGTAEIYRALNHKKELQDYLIVHLDNDGRDFMPLFVVIKEGYELTPELKKEIQKLLRAVCSPRHVPDVIIEVADVPYTISGKKMEAPVKKVLSGQDPGKSLNKDAMRNPAAMDIFIDMAASGQLD